jgi:hypothetical protein
MKRYFLSYNEITKNYFLDYGCFDRGRQPLGNIDGKGLTKKLKEILPMHRQIEIYTQIDIDNSIKELLQENFKNTSVNIKFAKDLKSLC